jgi:predicted DsbA family dithiol-disulfide isomerase
MAEVHANPLGAEPLGFTVLRVPFFLEPDYPEGEAFEETNRVRLVRKWGGQAGWDAQKKRHDLKGRGRAVGIEKFNLDRVASNTLTSHRLVQWVTKHYGVNAAEKMYADLNHRHFELGKKLNDRAMLLEVAVAAGAELSRAMDFLDDPDAGREEITAAQAKLRELGVSGIPTLLLGGEWQLPSGALHADDIVPALRMVEERGGATGSFFAETLGISDAVMEETLHFAP